MGIFEFEFNEEEYREAIFEDGIEFGRTQGMEHGQFMTLAGLVRDKTLTLEQAAGKISLPIEDFLSQCKKYNISC